MSRVWVYPEREWQELGAVRWQVSTEIVLPEALSKDDIDIDQDVVAKAWGFPTYEKAEAYVHTVLQRDDLAFGAVQVQKQTVDWFVEEYRIGEWADVGSSEEFTRSNFEEGQ